MSAALVSQRLTKRDGNTIKFLALAAAVKLLAGVLWARNAAGYITNASDATGLKVVGVGRDEVDNAAGAAGDLPCVADKGIFLLVNSAASPLTRAHIGLPCFVEDNQTVSASGGLYGVVAGLVFDVDSEGVWVIVGEGLVEATPFRRPVLVSAAAATLTPALSGGIISNLGAVAAIAFGLPPAVPGLEFIFLVEVAQELRVDPYLTETVAVPSTGVQGAAGKYMGADAIGEKVHYVCVSAGTWDVVSYSGTWTVEA